jgi:hypothetical protein
LSLPKNAVCVERCSGGILLKWKTYIQPLVLAHPGENFGSLEDMMYGKIKERYTPQGCKVVEVKSVGRKRLPGCDTVVLTPRVDIYLSGPDEGEKDVDKANDL